MRPVDDRTLYLTEIFASVQGETSIAGWPTTFVRLSACNLRCTWCDTTYSFSRGEPWLLPKIIETVAQNGCRYVCITGGEPLLQAAVYPLMTQLCDLKYFVSLETGGSLPILEVDARVKIILDIKCPGSGMSHKNDWHNLSNLKVEDEVKFVLFDRIDYDYAKDICTAHQLFAKNQEILFSPVHGKLDPRDLVNWILADQLCVRLNLQLHKFIWHPSTRGV